MNNTTVSVSFTAETHEALLKAIQEYLSGNNGGPFFEATLEATEITPLTPTAPAVIHATPLSPPAHIPDGGTTPPSTPGSADVDAAGTPWDGRIHTSNKGTKANGEWKRKPGLANEEYERILGEVKAQQPAPTPEAAPVPVNAPELLPVNAPVSAPTPPLAPVATTVPAATPVPGPNLNDVQAKCAQLVATIPAPLGTHVFTKVLTQFGAVANSVEGQPPMPTIAALQLQYYPGFLATCDVLLANAATLTMENYESMVEVNMQQGAA